MILQGYDIEIPDSDLQCLNSLPFLPEALPSFEALKECLVWSDERPTSKLTADGRNFLYDLWIARGYIHKKTPKDEWRTANLEWWKEHPFYFQDIVAFGLKYVPNWPGFKRLELSESDRQYLNDCLNAPHPLDGDL